MLTTAATVAVVLIVLGELLRVLLHFTIGSLSIAGGVILLALAVWMVLGPADRSSHQTAGKDPMQLAQFPLAVPYLPCHLTYRPASAPKTRQGSMEAFSDGVLGFATTLLAVDLAVRPPGGPLQQLLESCGRRCGSSIEAFDGHGHALSAADAHHHNQQLLLENFDGSLFVVLGHLVAACASMGQ